MTTALVVSRMFPGSPQLVHGIFQRLAAQIEALGRVVDRIDCLFLVESERSFSAAQIEAHQERLSRQWSTPINLTVAPVARTPRTTGRWRQFATEVFDFHRQPIARDLDNPVAVQQVAAALRAGPDLVLAHRLSAMCTLLRLKAQLASIPLFFDLDDIEHLAETRRLLRKPEWPGEQIKLLRIPRLLLAEIEAIRLSRRTLICSGVDLRYLQRYVGGDQLEVIANSTVLPALGEHDRSEPVVLFVGSMIYEPNTLAAQALVRDIWPRVLAQVPGARLVIAGMHPERIPAFSQPPAGVTFSGFVEDLRELYATARVVCCPILYGGGTRVKIIEAAAYGCAVVATPLAAEGLDFRDGTEIVLRKDPAQLAQECVRLLRNPEQARRLGAAARDRARGSYDRKVILARLEQLFRSGLNQPAR